MCGILPFNYDPRFTRRVVRSVVRHRRIYAFAADRWAEAKTPNAMLFWRGVMDRCVKTEVDYESIPFDEMRWR